MELKADIPVYDNITDKEFLEIVYPQRRPVILRNFDVGCCVEKWTISYLSEKVGDKPVKIHVSETVKMDFLKKNFQYKTLPFSELIQRSSEESHTNYFLTPEEVYYLRSLGSDPRGKEIANIELHYPELSQDFTVPKFISKNNLFSTVFRIASKGVQLWTHYDVMDNLLIQIRGRKRALLYAPHDALYLYLDGDKSQVIDVDNPDKDLYPEFLKAQPYEGIMEEGDVLFIPALWFHNMTALDFSVAINVFWKNLNSELYDKKDPYGNKDPLPASKALQMLDSALKQLSVLPEDFQDFYRRRMISKIQQTLK